MCLFVISVDNLYHQNGCSCILYACMNVLHNYYNETGLKGEFTTSKTDF